MMLADSVAEASGITSEVQIHNACRRMLVVIVPMKYIQPENQDSEVACANGRRHDGFYLKKHKFTKHMKNI
jgi:hypothetical protein